MVPCLLQIYIAKEESKFGLDEVELLEIIEATATLTNVSIQGFMGMASFTENTDIIQSEFNHLNFLFKKHIAWIKSQGTSKPILSMGMSGDYSIAIEQGSTMVRIGSLLFGARNYAQ